MKKGMYTAILLCMLCIIFYLIHKNEIYHQEIASFKRDTIELTDTFYKHDTIRSIPDTVYKDSFIRYIKIKSENNGYANIPIKQNLYTDNKTYKLWVSGAFVNVDSVYVYRKHFYERNIRHVYKYQDKLEWRSYAYMGINNIKGDFSPSVGISFTSPKKWVFSLEAGMFDRDVWGGFKIGYKLNK